MTEGRSSDTGDTVDLRVSELLQAGNVQCNAAIPGRTLGASTLLRAPRLTTRSDRTLLGAPGPTNRNKKLLGAPGLTTRNKKLVGASGLATRNKKLLGAPGLTTRNKSY